MERGVQGGCPQSCLEWVVARGNCLRQHHGLRSRRLTLRDEQGEHELPVAEDVDLDAAPGAGPSRPTSSENSVPGPSGCPPTPGTMTVSGLIVNETSVTPPPGPGPASITASQVSARTLSANTRVVRQRREATEEHRPTPRRIEGELVTPAGRRSHVLTEGPVGGPIPLPAQSREVLRHNRCGGELTPPKRSAVSAPNVIAGPNDGPGPVPATCVQSAPSHSQVSARNAGPAASPPKSTVRWRFAS